MSEDNKKQLTLSDEDMVTQRRISRRSLLAGAAIGGVAMAATGGRAFAAEDEKDKGTKDKGDQTGKDKSKIETTRDKD